MSMSDGTQETQKSFPGPSRPRRQDEWFVLPCVVVACCHHIPAAAQRRIARRPSLVGNGERKREGRTWKLQQLVALSRSETKMAEL